MAEGVDALQVAQVQNLAALLWRVADDGDLAGAVACRELLDDYYTRLVFWQRHEDIVAAIVRAERRAGRSLKRQWVALLKLAHALSRRPCRRMSTGQVVRLIGPL